MDIKYPDLKIGFFGHGKMYQALSTGFVAAKLVKAENVLASNLHQTEPETTLPNGMKVLNSNIELVRRSDVVMLSVKPHIVPAVLKEVQQHLQKKHLFVSIAAGITLAQLQQMLPPEAKLIRTMPNTPSLVNCGATVFSEGSFATASDIQLADALFTSVGLCEQVPEKFIDICSAVSGSGPAYAFMAIDALADGGVKMGLPRDKSIRYAAQMMMGAAKMVLETGKHPGELKDAVCSPGGSTIRAVHELEKRGFRAGLIDAVESATLQNRELSKV